MEGEFINLIEVNRQRILRICQVYAWTAPDQEDLYQEILFQIWRGLPRLREHRHANTWLYRVALNTAISFVRKARTGPNLVPTDHEQLRAWADQRQEHSAESDPDPQVDRLYEALAKLNAVEKGMITLYLEDLSYEEIGEVMGTNANQVGVMLHRTRKKLSALMQEMEV
jgi:RNA polymerase sigma-70 factor (ECF subfamily)